MNVAPARKNADPTFAVAFGGGGARGLAHIHVIEVLDEMGVRPVAISGSSIGAIMGACMASGMSGKDIRDYTLAVMTNRAEVMNRIWKLRPSGIGGFLTNGFKLTQFDIEGVVEAFMPPQVKRDFSELAIPLSVTGTDYYMQEEVIMETGDLRSAIAASAAIPALFRSVKRDGRILIDGGIFNPVPFEHLEGKADFVIGIDVVGGPEGDPSKLPGTIDVLFGASQLMMQSIITMKLKASRPAIFLRPPVNKFRVMDFLKAKTILDATASVRDELKRSVDAAITFAGKTGSNVDA
ncbi:MAG: patatin-like phospholipase family protein [Rhizobiaceae bacterium]